MATAGEDSAVTVFRLRKSLESCTELTEAGDFVKCEEELSELVAFLNSVSEAIADDDGDGFESKAFEIFTEIHQFITSSSPSQAVIDAVSFQLPKVAARFGCASQRCLETAESVVDCFTHKCNSRDMLSILCEALAPPTQMFNLPAYFIPLLTAFPKVFVSLRRRPFQNVKSALPIILNTLNSLSRDDDDALHLVKLFQTLNCIADSLKTLCLTLQGEDSDKLRALLGLFVLQTMALLSMAMKHTPTDWLPLVIHLSQFLPFCGLSCARLITGSHVSGLLHMALGDDQDDFMGSFSHIWLGASLTVIWGLKWNEVAIAAEEDLSSLVYELQTSRTKRWEAVGMLKHVFLCVNLPWPSKQQAINFLLSILGGNSLIPPDQDADCSENMPSLYTTLQAIQMVIMRSPEAVVRKNAFAAFKKLLADIPTSPRFDILRAMIENSDSSSMIALLLDSVREEMHAEYSKRSSAVKPVLNADSGSSVSSCFWSAGAFELVELVLRPPGGGPPLLPENCDAVLSALNLYRFILITESTGKTNYTGMLVQDRLEKLRNEWLLPLRILVMSITAEKDKDGDDARMDISCGLNPIEFVLHRCIELTEQNLKC